MKDDLELLGSICFIGGACFCVVASVTSEPFYWFIPFVTFIGGMAIIFGTLVACAIVFGVGAIFFTFLDGHWGIGKIRMKKKESLPFILHGWEEVP